MHVQTPLATAPSRDAAGPPVSRRRIEAAIAVLTELTAEPEVDDETLGDLTVAIEVLGRISERARVFDLAAARRRRERASQEEDREARAAQTRRTPLRPAVAGGEIALWATPARALAGVAAPPPSAPAREEPVRVQVTVTASPAPASSAATSPGAALAALPAAAVAVRLGPPAAQRQLWPARAAWGMLGAALLLLAVVVLGGTVGHLAAAAVAVPVAAGVAGVTLTSSRGRIARARLNSPTD